VVKLYLARQSAQKVPSEIHHTDAESVKLLAEAGKIRADSDVSIADVSLRLTNELAVRYEKLVIDHARLVEEKRKADRRIEHLEAERDALEKQAGLKPKDNGKGQ
jgi:hypothetical protein